VFKRFKRSAAANRLLEESLYNQALTELESGEMRGGLWAKALVNASGDEQKARGLYLRYRVQAMIDEAEVAERFPERIHDRIDKKTTQEETRSKVEKAIPFEGITGEELIKKLGITYDSEYYYYSKYKYKKLQEAISYARLDTQRDK
jgi:hypothetical protein